jgi:hypothetical protein
VDGRAAQAGDYSVAQHICVTSGYFETLRATLTAGRTFTTDDRSDTEAVVVVNQSFARRVFPGEDPIGRRLVSSARYIGPLGQNVKGPGPFRIVGVIAEDGGLPDVSWFSSLGTAVDWNGEDAALIALLTAPDPSDDPENMGRDVLLLVNATTENREFILPPVAKGTDWRLFIDTAATPPQDMYPDLDGPSPPGTQRLVLMNRSLCCYVAAKRLAIG